MSIDLARAGLFAYAGASSGSTGGGGFTLPLETGNPQPLLKGSSITGIYNNQIAHASGLNKTIILNSSSTIYVTSNAGDTFTTIQLTQTYRNVAASSNRIVLVGTAGEHAVSTDGVYFAEYKNINTVVGSEIRFDSQSGKFISFSTNSYGSYSTSSDGITWEVKSGWGSENNTLSKRIGRSAYSSSLNKALRLSDAGSLRKIAVSNDSGVTWDFIDDQYSLTTIIWSDVHSMFIAGSLKGEVYTSTDGSTWVKRTNTENKPLGGIYTGQGAALHNIFWTGSNYYASGSGKILQSSDGITWVQTQTPDSFISTAYSPEYNLTVAIPYDTGYGSLYYSHDKGVTWHRSLYVTDLYGMFVKWIPELKIFFIGAGSYRAQGAYYALKYENIVGSTSYYKPQYIVIQSIGANVTSNGALTDVIYFKDRLYAAVDGNNGGYVATSKDGEIWDDYVQWNDSYDSGSAKFAIQNNKLWLFTRFKTRFTNDGRTWHLHNLGETTDTRCRSAVSPDGTVVTAGDPYSIGGNNIGVSVTKYVGNSAKYYKRLSESQIKDVVWNEGEFIVIDVDGCCAKSSDGLNWTVSDWNGNMEYREVYKPDGQNLYFAVKFNDFSLVRIRTSTDGLNWTPSTITGFPENTSWFLTGNVFWTGSMYITGATGAGYGAYRGETSDVYHNEPYILTSTDGYNWTAKKVSFAPNLSQSSIGYQEHFLNQSFPISGAVIQGFYKAADGKLWMYGSSGILAYTTDNGNNWVWRTVPSRSTNTSRIPDAVLKMVEINSAIVIFQLAFDATLGDSKNVISKTTDNGLTWTIVNDKIPGATGAFITDVVYANNKLFACHTNKLLISSDAGVTWSSTTMSYYYYRLINTGTKIIASSCNNSTKATSGSTNNIASIDHNGSTWTEVVPTAPYLYRNNAGNGELYSIVWTGSKLLGYGNGRYTVQSTDNGTSWTSAISETQYAPIRWMSYESWGAVKLNGVYYMSVDYGTIVRSTDFINWSIVHKVASNSDQSSDDGWGNFFNVVNNKLVGSYSRWDGSTSTEWQVLVRSDDGINWTSATVSPAVSIWDANGIGYGGGKYIIYGWNDISYSTDLVNWTKVTNKSWDSYTGFAYINSVYYLATANYSGGLVYSTDGINWTSTVLPWSLLPSDFASDTTYNTYKDVNLIYEQDGKLKLRINGAGILEFPAYDVTATPTYTHTLQGSRQGRINNYIYRHYQCTAYSSNVIYCLNENWTYTKVDSNGITFVSTKIPSIVDYNVKPVAIIWTGYDFVILDESYNIYSANESLTTVTLQSIGVSFTNRFAYIIENKIYVVQSFYLSNTSASCIISRPLSGSTWTKETSINSKLNAFDYYYRTANFSIISGAALNGTSATMLDNTNTGAFTTQLNITGNIRRIINVNNTYVVLSNNYGSSLIYYTTDNFSTVTQASLPTSDIEYIDWTGSEFIAIASTAVTYSSADGITWTTNSPTTDTGINGNLLDVLKIGSKYIGFFQSDVASGLLIYESTNPKTSWTNRLVTTTNTRDVVYHSGSSKYYFAGGLDYGTNPSVSYATSLTSIPQLVIGDSGVTTYRVNKLLTNGTVLVGITTGATVLNSTNGTSWQAQSVSTTVRTGAYGNGYFVLGGTGGKFYRSTDASSWTEISTGFTSYTINHITHVGGSTFVATSTDNPAVLLRSTDTGATWSVAYQQVYFSSVIVVGTKFVAIKPNDNKLYESTNGVTWSSTTPYSASAGTLVRLHYNGSKVYLVWKKSDNTSARGLSSTDLISWADFALPSNQYDKLVVSSNNAYLYTMPSGYGYNPLPVKYSTNNGVSWSDVPIYWNASQWTPEPGNAEIVGNTVILPAKNTYQYGPNLRASFVLQIGATDWKYISNDVAHGINSSYKVPGTSTYVGYGANSYALYTYSTDGQNWKLCPISQLGSASSGGGTGSRVHDVKYENGIYTMYGFTNNSQAAIFKGSSLSTITYNPYESYPLSHAQYNKVHKKGYSGRIYLAWKNDSSFITASTYAIRLIRSPQSIDTTDIDALGWQNLIAEGSTVSFPSSYSARILTLDDNASGSTICISIQGVGVYTSTDSGSTWALTRSTSLSTDARSIVYNGSYFAMYCTDGSLYSSTDGITWTYKANRGGQWGRTLFWTGSRWLAYSGYGSSGTTVMHTGNSDGTLDNTWTTTSVSVTQPSNAYGYEKFINTGSYIYFINGLDSSQPNIGYSSNGGVSWTFGTLSFTAQDMVVNPVSSAPLIAGGASIYTVSGGTTSASLIGTTPYYGNFNSLIAATPGNNRIYAITSSGHISKSTAGNTWDAFASIWPDPGYLGYAFAHRPSGEQFANSRYVRASYNGLCIQVSDNKVLWKITRRNTNSKPYMVKAVSNASFTGFVAFDATNSTIVTSTDGVTWTQVSSLQGDVASNPVEMIVSANRIYVMYNANNQTYIKYAWLSNVNSWFSIGAISTFSTGVNYLNSLYDASDDSLNLYYSSNTNSTNMQLFKITDTNTLTRNFSSTGNVSGYWGLYVVRLSDNTFRIQGGSLRTGFTTYNNGSTFVFDRSLRYTTSISSVNGNSSNSLFSMGGAIWSWDSINSTLSKRDIIGINTNAVSSSTLTPYFASYGTNKYIVGVGNTAYAYSTDGALTWNIDNTTLSTSIQKYVSGSGGSPFAFVAKGNDMIIYTATDYMKITAS